MGITAGCDLTKSEHGTEHQHLTCSRGDTAPESKFRDFVAITYMWNGEFQE